MFGTLWWIKCKVLSAKMNYYILKGDREKAQEQFEKCLKMVECYKEFKL